MNNLYKAFLTIALVLVVGTFAVGTALAATITTDSNSFITVLTERISPMNRNLLIQDHSVTVNWMTNQFTDGFVILTDDMGYSYTFEAEETLATYHTVKFSMPAGTYEITRVSYGGLVKDFVQEVIIK